MQINNLDNRLKLIASFVRKGVRVADIGCDHAYVISALVNDGIVKYAIGVDNKIGPLQNAKKQKNIDCRLGDGLSVVKEDEADDIIIAGMGGENIIEILSNCQWSKNKDKRYILNPMTKPEILRIWLYENGFNILFEKACVSANKPYTVMNVTFTGKMKKLDRYSAFSYTGLLEKDDISRIYVEKVINQLKKEQKGNNGKELEELIWHLTEF